MAKQAAPGSVDEYIHSFPPATQQVLEEVRAHVRSLVPGATERISYGMPTFELDGQYLVYLGGWKSHVSIYPVSASAADVLGDAVEPYLSGKGTLKFPLAKPLPVDLVRRFIEVRRQEVATRRGPAK